MQVFLQRILLIGGISSLMNLFIGLETTVASPLCYMVDEFGQTIDLSYLCTQKVIKDDLEANRQQRNENEGQRAILNRRIAVSEENQSQPIQNSRFERVNVPEFPGSDARDYYGTRRTVSLDGLSNNFSRSSPSNISGQYVLNNQGELQLRHNNNQ